MKQLVRAGLAVCLVAMMAPAGASATTFANYPAPTSLPGANDAGEPSIGFNPKTGMTFVQAGVNTLKVDLAASPPAWSDVTSPLEPISLDPILWTDRHTGRTFSSQLIAACSLMSYTDSDGASWNPSQGCGVGTAFDHQTVGGGPFSAGDLVPHTYSEAVYYCAQFGAGASCAISRDGGLTFGPGVPIYTALSGCGGLHGHIKVGPDGTAYVPNSDCNGKQSLAYSKDGGATWAVDSVPDSKTQDESDPSLGIGSNGTLYMGYEGADKQSGATWTEGHPWIAVKPAGSSTWRPSIDVGAALGIKNVQFPEVVAGDDDRAAFAFLGTTTAGDDQSSSFAGVWHLYVAMTYDQGQTWTVTDATPNDPVQRGCIWLGGGSNTCRNLLDFNDATIDGSGNVLVAYADGCTGACVTDATKNTHDALATVARQTSGTGLLASATTATTGTATPSIGAKTVPGIVVGRASKPTSSSSKGSAKRSAGARPLRLRIRVVGRHGRLLVVRGTLARGAEGRLRVLFRKGRVRVLSSGVAHRGTYQVTLTLPRGVRGGTVFVSYLGKGFRGRVAEREVPR